ncbi:Beta-galactosidase 16 [Citrus sinensis]|uniref:Beta-galactosidase 16 n=1 Tax=Citrus sinensis TaxID=2711 RepID=A0ACB8KRP8_CITSI|nr:Beta-galactosidase 16 [Citrus sinensis]
MLRLLSCYWCFMLFLAVIGSGRGHRHEHHDDRDHRNVTYEGRSLIINGHRKILFSGSIHYPRSTPQMWPSLIAKAKEGGLDVIQTYVFWNLHEPQKGQYDFSGRNDIIRFIKEIQSQGLYVCLRIGPFIESEWTYGGLPIWLHDVAGIVFRSDNKPYKYYMQRFVTKIVNMMKSEKLYASQGGPIILSQIENEYQTIEPAFHEKGPPYVLWAAKMAVDFHTGVPWVMCKQDDAPGPVYHGGTNFGRTAAAFMITGYYDQAPLDEYGLVREPKWGHLKELHAAIKLCSRPLLTGTQNVISLGQLQEAFVFEETSGVCAAFLVNNDERKAVTVLFRNISYELPRKSISILPDCKTVAFNTERVRLQATLISTVSTQYNKRSKTSNLKFDSDEKWEEYREAILNFDNTLLRAEGLLDQISAAKDASDYFWYTFRFHYNSSNAQAPLDVQSHGHILHAFVNGEYTGSAHGSHDNVSFTLRNTVHLRQGTNDGALLSVTVGLPDSGAFLERKVAGVHRVRVQDKSFTNCSWGYQTTFRAPAGNDPIALNLQSMGKGEAWVNGQSIGRYWVSFKTSKGNPSQTRYHVPRGFLKPTGNLLVLLEEENGNPLGITVDTIAIRKVCGHVTNSHLPPLSSWLRHRQRGDTDIKKFGKKPTVQPSCPLGKKISKIVFASFGNPDGDCERYAVGSCHSSHSQGVVERACMGKSRCSIPLSSRYFGGDPCPGIHKALLVDAQCR